ncbi:unnamed protein product [Prorocentrum cordatum]|uniref:Uncharacterized protein n=1 Tax=Prorocentrum cordatum TaxID=2364126 RepID=A0ABN9ST82_9DINO|nr:unnamed protein product [Polarella glacialis]
MLTTPRPLQSLLGFPFEVRESEPLEMSRGVWGQIKALETEVAMLRSAANQNMNSGGPPNQIHPTDEFDKWISRVLADAKAIPPVQTYVKGEFSSFHGVAFGKYSSAVELDAAAEAVRKASREYGGNKVLVKPEQPLETWALQSVRSRIKKMLVVWGFDKKSLWADASTMSASCGSDLVIKMAVDNKTPTLEYGLDWEICFLTNGAIQTVTSLLDAAREKLQRSSAPSKGLGKELSRAGLSANARKTEILSIDVNAAADEAPLFLDAGGGMVEAIKQDKGREKRQERKRQQNSGSRCSEAASVQRKRRVRRGAGEAHDAETCKRGSQKHRGALCAGGKTKTGGPSGLQAVMARGGLEHPCLQSWALRGGGAVHEREQRGVVEAPARGAEVEPRASAPVLSCPVRGVGRHGRERERVAMPRGPGKASNYSFDYSRFNAAEKAGAEEAAPAAPEGGPDMRELLKNMPGELQEAYRLMMISKESGDKAAEERANELALMAIRRGSPEVQQQFVQELSKKDPHSTQRDQPDQLDQQHEKHSGVFVCALFQCVARLRVMAFQKPPRISLDRCIGPPCAPPACDHIRAELEGVLRTAQLGKGQATQEGLNRAHQKKGDQAEIELCRLTNQDIRLGLRGAKPKIIWKKLIDADMRGPRRPDLFAARWLHKRLVVFLHSLQVLPLFPSLKADGEVEYIPM